MILKNFHVSVITLLMVMISIIASGQSIYTARSYWQESTKSSYLSIKEKRDKGQPLTADEVAYLKDYDNYLQAYYNRLSDEEKQEYLRMKEQWDREASLPLTPPQAPVQQAEQTEFEWRGRDRLVNGLYGVFYGASISVICEFQDAAAAGVPLIMGGLWMIGPAFNQKKYEGITESTMRASNSGKLLGVLYGASFGLALAGDSESVGKVMAGLATVGSITLGEIAFQTQKKRQVSDGKIELMRHYGILGMAVGGSVLLSTNTDDLHLVGLGLLAGGVGGLFVGKAAANKYDYTRGDVDALSSLSVISAGLGSAIIGETDVNENPEAFLLPVAFAYGGTLIGQRMVRGIHLTKRQGSTINLATAGGALIGLGVMAFSGGGSNIAVLGVPSLLALSAHQIVFQRYKKINLFKRAEGKLGQNKKYEFAMKLLPENYFVNRNTPQRFINDPRLASSAPLVNMSLKFK